MARDYAKIWTGLWRNPTWTRRCIAAQWLYLLMVSQPELTPVGVLPLDVERWTGLAGADPDDVTHALHELEEAELVMVDRDARLVLLRRHVNDVDLVGWDTPLGPISEALRQCAVRDLNAVWKYAVDHRPRVSSAQREDQLVLLYRLIERLSDPAEAGSA